MNVQANLSDSLPSGSLPVDGVRVPLSGATQTAITAEAQNTATIVLACLKIEHSLTPRSSFLPSTSVSCGSWCQYPNQTFAALDKANGLLAE